MLQLTPAVRRDIQKAVVDAVRSEIAGLYPPKMPYTIDSFGLARIRDACCLHFGVTVREICGQCRAKNIVDARHIWAWLARKTTGASYPVIGRSIGGRDHTSIMHAVRRVEYLRERYTAWRETTDMLFEELGGN